MPKYFIDMCGNVVKSGECEEVVAESVDESQEVGMDGGGAGEGDDASFGSAGYGAGYVGMGGVGGAGWEDEVVEGWEGGVEGVDVGFEACDVGGGDSDGDLVCLVGGAGEVGSDVEDAVLEPEECGADAGVGGEGVEEAYVGVEFVECAVGFEACGVFVGAGAADE